MKKSIFAKIFLLSSSLMILLAVLVIGANKFYLKDYYIKKEQHRLLEIAREIRDKDNEIDGEIEDLIQKNAISVSIIDKEGRRTDLNEGMRLGFGNGRMGFSKQEESSLLVGEYAFDTSVKSRFNIEVMKLNFKSVDDSVIIMEIPIEDMKKSIDASNEFLLGIVMAALVFGNAVAWVFSKQLVRPIVELDGIAQNMCKLDFSEAYRGKQEDEIGNLGASINKLSSSLQDAIEELQEDIRLKDENIQMRREFISGVSHELKTPIALIQGYAHALLENISIDEVKKDEYARIIIEESENMNNMVKDLLDLSKLEWKMKKFTIEEFDISSLLDETLDRYGELFNQKNIEVDIDAEDIIFIHADKELLAKAMDNYLTNAIKHLKAPNIIRVKLKKKGQNVRFEIYNSGEAIKDADIKRIWESFFKSDKARSRDYEGSGLGLSIVKEIILSHGGEYGLSNMDGGVQFYFEIPVRNLLGES